MRLIPEKGTILDFTMMQGDLEKDLSGRDFTVNSIGYNPSEGIIDFTGGVGDLERGIIRTVKEANIINDPVRIVRGYRFLNELQGSFDEETRAWLVRNRELLAVTAPERITMEFIRTFRGVRFLSALKEAAEDGILGVILRCKNSELNDIINKLHYIYRKIKVTPYGMKNPPAEPVIIRRLSESGIEILGERLDLFKLLCLELLLLKESGGAQERRPLIIVPARLKGRIRGLMRVMDRESLPTGPEERFDIYREAWPAVFEFLLYLGRGDLFSEAEEFMSLAKEPPVRGARIRELRPDLAGNELGRLADDVRKGVFAGRLRRKDEIDDFILGYKI